MASRWMPSAVALALVMLVGCSGRLPRPVEVPPQPTAERPPIVEQHTTGQAPDSPGTVTAPVGAGTLERDPAPEVPVDEVTKDPILEKIHEELEEEADEVRQQQ